MLDEVYKPENSDIKVRYYPIKNPIKVSYPESGVELIHTIISDDYSKTEKKLHEDFSHKRLNGEWFKLDLADVELIKSITKVTYLNMLFDVD